LNSKNIFSFWGRSNWKRLPSWRLHGCNPRCCKWQVGQDAANQLTDQPAINERPARVEDKSATKECSSLSGHPNRWDWSWKTEERRLETVQGAQPRVPVYLWRGRCTYICSRTCMHPGAGFNARSVASKPDRY